jgi:hypothetical protein
VQRKALSIRRRFGESGDALDGPFPAKPAKMRCATYKRVRAVDGHSVSADHKWRGDRYAHEFFT